MKLLLSFMLFMRNLTLYMLIAVTLLAATVSFAQSQIEVYSLTTKSPITSVSDENNYEVVGGDNQWAYIRFNEPTIHAWLSTDYVLIDDVTKTALVRTDNLNARAQPTLNAPIINQIDAGYQANILDESEQFIKVFAPTSFIYAIDNDQQIVAQNNVAQINQKSASGSGWIVPNKVAVADQTMVTSDDAQLNTDTATNKINLDVQTTAPIESDNNSFEKSVFAQTDESAIGLPQEDGQYRLATGDSISVTVFGEPDLSLPSTRISQSGVISFPLIGSIQVAGKTTEEIETLLTTELARGYVINPVLTVTIAGYRPIFIRGAVGSTGSFTYTEGLTVAQALSLAGGTNNTAKPFGVSIERDGVVFKQNLSLNSNLALASGDVITVDEEVGFSAEGQLLYVYLHGEVNKPGEYQYRPGLTVEKAVVLAGGFGLRASKRKISVSRYTEGEQIPEIMKKVPLYLPVQPGDIINVGASWF